MRPRQRGRAVVLAAEAQPFQQHVVAAGGMVGGQAEHLVQAAIGGAYRVAAAAGRLVVAEHGERPAAERMAQPIGDRALPPRAPDRLEAGAGLPAIGRQDAPDELRLAGTAGPPGVDD
ncbi:MAG TPA: hypothetical protein VFO41_08610 [Alphaproteobacteria bacterium]|nr:hypothetical protein [Alphaproteobacteria bacterium]